MEVSIIQQKIDEIRGQKVMLDFDLAVLYEVTTGALNQAMKRNIDRFPPDFMFQLTREEYNSLRSQFVTSCFYIYAPAPSGRHHRMPLKLLPPVK